MTIPEHEAQKKLRDAIETFVKDVAGPTAIATDYVFTIASADMNAPGSVTRYFEGYRGPMHALMGLNKMQHEFIVAQNNEEANYDDNDD